MCMCCLCKRDPRRHHATSHHRALPRGVCFLLYIHRLSPLRSHPPSCRTLLPCCILPLLPPSPGSSSATTPAPALSNLVALWLLLPRVAFFCNHEWKLGESSTLQRFLFVGGRFSPENTDNVGNPFLSQMCFITLCLLHIEVFWSLPSLFHTLKAPGHTHPFCCKAVVCSSLN